jgi:DNA-binding response OmpR family regulator
MGTVPLDQALTRMNITHHQATRTVLLAENDVLIRMPVAKYLRDCGYKVIEAVTAHEAIEVLDHERVTADAVISNLELAGDGFGIAKWVREHKPEVKILLSGTPERSVQAAAELCRNAPGWSPVDPQLLLRQIRRLLANRHRPARDAQRAV